LGDWGIGGLVDLVIGGFGDLGIWGFVFWIIGFGIIDLFGIWIL
jgi:hypothetical protein